jgi:two-component system NarL family response regulator
MKKPPPIRVLLVDDHFVVRIGLASLVNSQPDMKVIAEAGTGVEAVELYAKHRPEIVLMDLRLPGMTGAEATAAICSQYPEARVIVLTTYGGDENIYRALHAGARAYLLKDVRREDFLSTLRSVHAGESHLPSDVAMRLLRRDRSEELSARETEVLRLVARGRSNKEIADLLSISESTVKNHMTSILAKLRAPDRAGAVATAMRDGLVTLE